MNANTEAKAQRMTMDACAEFQQKRQTILAQIAVSERCIAALDASAGRVLRLHSTVVVSNLHIDRMAYQHDDGRTAVCVRERPTLWSRKDAEAIAADFNAMFKDQNNPERLRTMDEREWWAARIDALRNALTFADKTIAEFSAQSLWA